MTDKKIREIKKMLNSGVPEGEIKIQLQEEGFSDEDIKKAFKPQPYDMRSWVLFFGITISCFGIYIIMTNGSFLPVILGGILLWEYYRLDLRAKAKRDAAEKEKAPKD